MKILIDARPLQTYSRYRGIGRYVDTLVDLFQNHDEFHFLFFRGDDIDERPENKIIIPSPRRGITFTDRFFLPRLLRKNKIDVYHSTAYALPEKVENVSFILTIYDITPILFPRYSSLKNRMIFKKILMSGYRADQIIAISNCTKNDLTRITGIGDEMISVIYPAVNLKRSVPGALPAYLNGLHREFVLYSGGFDGNKNVKTIIKALNIFKKPLVVTGLISGKNKKELIELVNPGIEDLIFFTGYVSDGELSALYGAARVFLFPSIYEGFGFPPLEALQMGTPSVVSSSGSLKEVLKDAAVYMEDPMDEKELAEKTISLWEKKAERDEISERGRDVMNLYSSDRLKDKLMDLYKSLFRLQD